MPPLLQLSLQEILSQTVSFFLLVVVLKLFAWKPLLAILDERKRRIADDMKRAAEQKAEFERLHQEITRRLAKIDEEARAKIAESVAEGRRISTEVQEEARTQAQGIVVKARETVEMELAKARVTLRDQVADMTVKAIERVLQQKMDAKSDKQLVDQAIAELEGKLADGKSVRS